ncbi:MAG: hypothetical protein ACR2HD_09750 [Solirubrobacteraceae bacterium]
MLLGDVLELRSGPVDEATRAAEPCLRAIGQALGEREVVLVAGNHDYQLVEEWITRLVGAPDAELEPEQHAQPAEASALAATVAGLLAPARVSVAYPGLWLAPGVYATHGHYLDRHVTLPAFERLGLAAVERWLAPRRGTVRTGVAGYEAVHAPLYALFYALAQHAGPTPARTAGDRRVAAGSDGSVRAWRRLARETRRHTPRTLALLTGLRLGVAAANRAGLGPLSARLDRNALRNAWLNAMRDVTAVLGVAAEHVIFGHSHRPGPLARDNLVEWAPARGVQLHNSGSWVYEPQMLGATRAVSPMWPGTAIRVRPGRAPELLDLLGDRSREDLAAALEPTARLAEFSAVPAQG